MTRRKAPNRSGKALMGKAHMNKALAQGDYQLLAQFRGVLRQFLAFSEAAAHDAGLTAQQHQALLALKAMPGDAPVTVGALAAQLGIHHNSAVGLVNRLAVARLLQRRPDPADGRRATLVLTAKAERALATLTAVHRDELRRLTPLLKPLLTEIGEED